MKTAARTCWSVVALQMTASMAVFIAGCGQPAAQNRPVTAAAPPKTPTTNALIEHPIIGRWTFPIDHRDGFFREFRPDGSVTVWWPDGRVAARGTFFVVGPDAIGAAYENKDTDVIVFIETNLIRISHVEHTGYHWRYHARRAEPDEAFPTNGK